MASQRVTRFGILGAARIAPAALIKPCRKCDDASVEAVASRNPGRARRFADKYGIPRIHDSYADLVGDPDIDVVYVALPNSHHALWTQRALDSGKHVLCEKPLASNADEADRVSQVAAGSGLILCEAMHYRFHPVAQRMKEHVDSGRLGRLRHIEAYFCIPPITLPGDIRLKFALAGGATMDLGCYLVDVLRFITGDEPEVTGAKAALSSTQIDRWMKAALQFAGGCTGHMFCSLRSVVAWKICVKLVGDDGSLHVSNPFVPHLIGHRLTLRNEKGTRVEKLSTEPSYDFQLRSFIHAIDGRDALPFDTDNAVANLRVIDEIYAKAGLKRRVGELT